VTITVALFSSQTKEKLLLWNIHPPQNENIFEFYLAEAQRRRAHRGIKKELSADDADLNGLN